MLKIGYKRRTLGARLRGYLWRLCFGDRVLVPSREADRMWHLQQSRSRIRGGEVVVRFDNLDADIAIDARSDLAMRAIGEGNYETEELAVIPKVIGAGDAINVGANVGIVAIVMRRSMTPGSRLLCVEPLEECISRLSRNLERAEANQGVTVHRAFASDKFAGSQEMWTVPGRPEYSSGGRLVHPSVAAADHCLTTVPSIRLDDLVAGNGVQPTCIVMDCEGGEYNALRGARETLVNHQPAIVMEFAPRLLEANGGSAGEFLAFLTTLEYRCMTLTEMPVEADETFTGTVIAVPTARADAVGTVIRSVFSPPR